MPILTNLLMDNMILDTRLVTNIGEKQSKQKKRE